MNKLADFSQNYTRYQNLTEESISFRPSVYASTIEHILSLVSTRLKKKSGDLRVLDAGCAGGGYTFELAKHVKKIVGIDADKRTIQIAEKRRLREHANNVTFVHS